MVAALCSGIGATTFKRWMQQGKRQRRGRYRAFWAAVKKAEAEAHCHMVAQIVSAAFRSGKAAAWWLERRDPAHWGNQSRVIRELLKDIKRLKATLSTR